MHFFWFLPIIYFFPVESTLKKSIQTPLPFATIKIMKHTMSRMMIQIVVKTVYMKRIGCEPNDATSSLKWAQAVGKWVKYHSENNSLIKVRKLAKNWRKLLNQNWKTVILRGHLILYNNWKIISSISNNLWKDSQK